MYFQAVLNTVVLEIEFDGHLRYPVWGNGLQRVLFVRGEVVLFAVPGTSGGGEDHLPDPVLTRRLEKNERAHDVFLRVEDRIDHGLAHADLRRVVAEDFRPEGPDRLDGGFRPGVSEDEPRFLRDVFLLPGGKVVQHEDLVTRFDVRLRDMGGDEPRPPGDHDPHRFSLRQRRCPSPTLHFPAEPIPLSPNVNFTLVSAGCVFRSTVNPTFQQSLRGYTVNPTAPSARYPFFSE